MTLTDPPPTTGAHPGGPRRTESPFPAVADELEGYYADDASGHDLAHVWRVFALCQRLAGEVGADREVVGCAALTHDLHRVTDEGPGTDPAATLSTVESVLRRAGVDDVIPAVTECVAVHDHLGFRTEDPDPDPGTVEAAVLRDADNLDAMGAVGVARTFAFGGAHGTPLWDHAGEEYSQIYHFEDKLLRLRGELHTDPAREMARERHEFLVDFFERFLAEWHGEA